jgi:hypothetical protein
LTGCGWITVDEKSYYIKPNANLTEADLTGVTVDLFTIGDSTTTCPNGTNWGTTGNDWPF